MKILFAPDYRKGLPYQTLLARELGNDKICVRFLSDYHRVLPLTRGIYKSKPDIFHLHWPEAYFPTPTTVALSIRKWKYPIDLFLATNQVPTVLTVHNILPHNRHNEFGLASLMQLTCQRARHIIAHTHDCKKEIVACYGITKNRISVVPVGDLSNDMPPTESKEIARARLNLESGMPLCLMFGRISPYKGIHQVVEWWQEYIRARLIIIGEAIDITYLKLIQEAAIGKQNVELRPARVTSTELALWLDATDATVFNYETILAPGAVQLAISRGVPSLLPERINSLNLLEPNSVVFRFDNLSGNFERQLSNAITQPHDAYIAQKWKADHEWRSIAIQHIAIYKNSRINN